MDKKILVFNVGSSSIKYSLFENKEKVDSGRYERLNEKRDYKNSVREILKKFQNQKIDLIAHRVVHGGELNKPSKINKGVKEKIKEYSQFAPLHNPNQLMVIELIEKESTIPQYALFDTMFFSELPEVSKIYAIPKEVSEKYNIRRYGFHGLSHSFVSRGIKGKTITCHLGSGASITAIKNGNPQDTTMGLTPLEGLVMGTRSGTIDPGLILFLEKKGYNTEELLTFKSGLKGICKYNDFRDILSTMNKNKDSKLAYDLFTYSIIKYLGSYIAILNGLDNLIFTASIGENVPKLRQDICDNLEFMGIKLNKKKNENNEKTISEDNSKVKVYVIKTDEEEQIVEEVLKL